MRKREMEESMNNEIGLENVENSQSDMITSHIKQLVTLRKSVKNSDRKVQCLKKYMSNLIESNRNIETNLEKLEENVFDIDAKITAATKIHDVKKQELKDLENTRANTLRKQWDDSLSKIGNYANDFSQWITEYSKDVLMKDIEDHQKECKKVAHEFAFLKKEVDDMRKKYDLNCIEANVDIDDLPNLDTVISNIKSSNNKLIHKTRSMEDKLNKIQKKLKQCKIAVNEYKMKENTKENMNIF
ncbi:uncharacterized protein LOC126852863 [Cataglyphis hispanica]|uniref:uncharacterized protein LOC126852863 n=1 Tax=Cataglyphis hispanica TaxID=1086592 RepID=UPI00217F6CC8|nr:uncharacterized protein LOC126852863 [Cataglyphis hispanica]